MKKNRVEYLKKHKKNPSGSRPFLKWAGGKKWLIDNYYYLFDYAFSCNRYIEPFLGSGSVFFYVSPNSSILNDKNKRLINTYVQVRDNWEKVYDHLKVFSECHSEKTYYEIRSRIFETKQEEAAQFIYLNRTCFNGLYRVNKAGVFNVPKGTKDTVIHDDGELEKISNLLSGAELYSKSYEEIIDTALLGDFVFIDPPYTVKHNNNGFIKYNESIYSWSDQEKLAVSVDKLNRKGVKFVLTNANSECIKTLYKNIGRRYIVERTSTLASKSEKRGPTTELVVTNIDIPSGLLFLPSFSL